MDGLRGVAEQWAIRGRSGRAKISEALGMGGERSICSPLAKQERLRLAGADWLVKAPHQPFLHAPNNLARRR